MGNPLTKSNMDQIYGLFMISMCFSVGFVLNGSLVEGEKLSLLVETTHGPVQGTRLGDCDVFWGIPYAQPPVGDLRWKSPQTLQEWSPEILQANSKPPGCVQVCDDVSYACPQETSEDCLFLNIYRPTTPRSDRPLPVMVFLHGGNFRAASCSGSVYDGRLLAPIIDSIVVCVEYRLGALGFLYLESDPETGEKIHGNFGIEDQTAALKFLKNNLKNFGGDPNRITLAGQSAGAESISIHLASPEHIDLFDQVILFSDPFAVPLKTPTDSNVLGLHFASVAGCENGSFSCLRDQAASDIAKASHESISFLVNPQKAFQLFQPWGPTVRVQPVTNFEMGLNAKKPIIMGSLGEEARIFVYDLFKDPLPADFFLMYLTILIPGEADGIRQHYTLSPNISDVRDIISSLVTDYLFTCSIRHVAKTIFEQGEKNVFSYIFDHPFSFEEVWERFTACYGHSCHGGDIPFIMLSAPLAGFEYTEEENELINKYWTYLSNFIHSGNPNKRKEGADVSQELLQWPEVERTSGHTSTMVFSKAGDAYVKQDMNSAICQYWDRVGYHGIANINRRILNI
ncbi:cAMP-regulated D2 protein [Holothuria leucospilota]|uniref:Carboxylic ester hydrolase n=1 Tax=Holothuria leucospilota TaxID=206669 RepID=A0A9Q1HEI2_HOLLE|nr:cAMP-regulated D2 protein [Holothuria leucospilota]